MATVGKIPSGVHQALKPMSRSRAAMLAIITIDDMRNTAATVTSL
jgi:hypothetical protein